MKKLNDLFSNVMMACCIAVMVIISIHYMIEGIIQNEDLYFILGCSGLIVSEILRRFV